MKRLIKTEFFKLARSDLYKRLLIACFFIALFSKDMHYSGIAHTTGFEWFCIVQLTGGLMLIQVCIFAADFTAGAFMEHTFTSGLMCGYRRGEVFGAKVIVYLVGLLPLFLVNTVTGTVSRSIQYGFGAELNSTTIVQMAIAFGYYILTHLLVIGTYFFFWAIVTKNRTGTIALGITTVQLMGSLTSTIGFKIENMGVGRFLFRFNLLYQIQSPIKPQTVHKIPFSQFVISAIVWFLFILLVSMHIFKRSDLS